MARFDIDLDYLKRVLVDLLNTPSPTGDTDWAVSFIQSELEGMDIPTRRTHKGALVAEIDGIRHDAPRALTAHVDTLGLMVRQIKSSGRLAVTKLNGINWPTIESEGVTISSSNGQQYRGSIVLTNGASHVNKDAGTAVRDENSLEIRIDERTTSAEETKLLGIEVGDFVYIDPRVEVSHSGFIRSRFLDDKACVACLLASLKALKDAGVTPTQDTFLLLSVHEEVGHGGMDGLPATLAEFVTLDMACIGKDLNGKETHCTLCMKDAGGPYSRKLSSKLKSIADKRGIDLRYDIYPYYSSDGTAYWRSGGTAEVALIGPGVDTSHGYERTHQDALYDTALLVAEYLVTD